MPGPVDLQGLLELGRVELRFDRVTRRDVGDRHAGRRSPGDFEQLARMVRPEDFEGRMLVSSDPDLHRAHLQRFVDLGVDRIHLHNAGPDQREFIEVFARDVLPKVTR